MIIIDVFNNNFKWYSFYFRKHLYAFKNLLFTLTTIIATHTAAAQHKLATTDLNQLQYLILNSGENNCSRCFNASVNNYTVYVETDDGSLSNVILVMYFPRESNLTTQKIISTIISKQLYL